MSFVQTQEKEQIKTAHHPLSNLLKSIQSKIIGQHQIIEQMLVCLLTDGHALLEGMPGLAKTRSAKAIADGIEGAFHRIQFTPDLLPSDLIGTEIYIHEKSDFILSVKGPLFLTISCSLMRSTAHLQKCNRLCSRRWKKSK